MGLEIVSLIVDILVGQFCEESLDNHRISSLGLE